MLRKAVRRSTRSTGRAPTTLHGKPELLAYEQSARWNKGFSEGGDAAVQATLDMITTFSQGKMDPEMFALYSPGSKQYKNLWERVVANANRTRRPYPS